MAISGDPFISYATYDRAMVRKLLDDLFAHLRATSRFDVAAWLDTDAIPLGSLADNEIATALSTCPFALLMLSPRSLGSDYVMKIEVPKLLAHGKKVIPVMLKEVNFGLHDLKAVEGRQVFRLEGGAGTMRCYSACSTPRLREQFALSLAARLVKDI